MQLNRRAFLQTSGALAATLAVEACGTTSEREGRPQASLAGAPASLPPGIDPSYALMYAAVEGERFPVPAVDLTKVNPAFLRREVAYPTPEPPGTIVVDPAARYLYLVGVDGMATRYGVGVGREGFEWSGTATVHSKQEWPDWYPIPEMLARRPDIAPTLVPLQSGMGLPGGPRNPIGARGLYLWQGNKDTLFRIHGTNEPHTIGLNVSSGCIRMINQDVIHLYARVPVGTEVKVLPVKLV
jgi:lipoprotein-anchoring transpeptidase ErfK/SrfK